MAKKLRREAMKRDEVLETVGKGFRFVSAHRKGAAEAIGVGAALAVLVGAFIALRAHREAQAADHLGRALAILSTPLTADPQAGAASKTYPTAAERRSDANRELSAAAEYGATRSGREAALVLAVGGDAKDAPSTFSSYARSSGSVVAAAAELDGYRALAGQGKFNEAIAGVKRAIETSSTAVPKDALLAELGRLYEESGSPADAKIIYQRLVSEYPESSYTAEAQSRIGSL